MLERITPLTRDYDHVSSFWCDAHRLADALHPQLERGPRPVRTPFLALSTYRDLGPVRHALSQRTVAGVQTIYPPMVARRSVPRAPLPTSAATDP